VIDPGPPAPTPLPTPKRLGRVQVGDLLLIVILGVGVVRLLSLVVGSLLDGSRLSAGEDGPDLVLLALVSLAVHATALIGAVYWIVVRARGVRWQDLGLRPIPSGWVTRAAVAAVIAFPIVAVVNLAIQSSMATPQQNPQLDFIAPAGFSWTSLVGMLVMAGAVVPFAEELFFRGLLYGWMRERIGVGFGAVISALCFSVLHGIPWLIPSLVILGVILALVYEKSGSLWAVVLTHGLFNATTTILLYTLLALGVHM
jgi:membrane protease YdiL (CAAX protease family)